EVGLAVVEVLAGNGVRVLVEEKFNCCGLPLIANGFLAEARKLAERNLFLLEKCFERGFRVVTSCPSCKLTLQREYGELLGLGSAGLLDGRVVDVFEFLLARAGRGEPARDYNPLPARVGYHQPCHLKAAGCGSPSRELLGLIPGLQVVDLDAGCCGLSGSYGFKRENYANSMAIGEELFRAVKETGVELVATECGACQLQIAHGTGAAVCHPVELFAKADGRAVSGRPIGAGGD
ncbi:MAG: heterodisulfide reductase-related iron-sulfur binding cluster, partial [Desulfotomaculales bacterium]